jgi:hypothetical protein
MAPGSLAKPLMRIQADQSGRLELVGIVSNDVATVTTAPAGISGEPTLIPIERQRAARLGATRAFRYFSLTVDRRTLRADEAPRVLGRDSSGRRVAESAVPASTGCSVSPTGCRTPARSTVPCAGRRFGENQ